MPTGRLYSPGPWPTPPTWCRKLHVDHVDALAGVPRVADRAEQVGVVADLLADGELFDQAGRPAPARAGHCAHGLDAVDRRALDDVFARVGLGGASGTVAGAAAGGEQEKGGERHGARAVVTAKTGCAHVGFSDLGGVGRWCLEYRRAKSPIGRRFFHFGRTRRVGWAVSGSSGQ